MAFTTLNGFALAGAGIGQEVGFAFAEARAAGVLFADLNLENATANAETSKEYARNPSYFALAIHVDVTVPESVQAMVDFEMESFGRLDYCVGATSLLASKEIDIDNFDTTLSINVKGTTMLCARAVSQAMSTQEPLLHQGRHGERSLSWGSIVNMASATSFVAGPKMMAYVASKHAVIGITKTAALDNIPHHIRVNALSLDNIPHHIRVNALCPSYVHTPMYTRSLARVPALGKLLERASPLKRPACVEEVANLAVMMCSPSASYVNGTGLLVDAGMLLSANV
ncbi:hypothetical protein HYALB_00007325 [Hymenoscyphus albidus]|uniref:Uncharacterized protein n=1 Tax=Hymenoscyphus albidus TaxID=595503 RepID=A0A9N9LEB6_9HELO|nr:hypothetical protein HYALB_00007325 [Hymenoscyphus albidus]